MTTTYPKDLHQEMRLVRAASAQLRREAFVPYRATVCGILLEPITLRTHALLVALGNGFVSAGGGTIEDIANFIWIHQPDFGQLNRRGRRRVYRRVSRHFFPGLHRLNDLLRGLRPMLPLWSRRAITVATRDTVDERFKAAISEIYRLLREAVEDMPIGERVDPEKTEPPLFAWQARIYNSLRRTLNMPYGEAESMPLKQLAQLVRETIDHRSEGTAMQSPSREAELIAEDLRRAPEAAQADLTDEERERYAEIHRRDAANG